MQITDLEGSYTEYESLIKFEETVANIRQILMEGGGCAVVHISRAKSAVTRNINLDDG